MSAKNEFQAKDPNITKQQDLVPQIQGLQAQNQQVYGQQQNLAQALQAQSQGQGPNPAQNMLNQATGQNVANQASLMAGQRGAGQNAGLIARQAGMAGANAQQGAAGQAATMGAQQQLGAQANLGALYGQMGQQSLQGQQVNQQALGQQNQQVNQAGLANNQINYQVAEENAKRQNSVLGNIFGGISGALTGGLMGGGGGGRSGGGQVVGGFGDPAQFAGYAAHGGEAGKFYGGESENKKVAKVPMSDRFPKHLEGVKNIYHPHFQAGGDVVEAKKGQKAEVKGDSYKNDKVPAMLSEGEVVLPRSVVNHPDAPQKAADFVAALQAKHGGGDFKAALARAIKTRKSK